MTSGEQTADYRERYQQERDKRMAARRVDIVRPSGSLKRYVEDPHTPRIERDAVNDEVDAVVVGGGFGGLLTAGRMKQAGLAKVRVIDAAGDVGGVWYWNRYPGAQCDVDAYCYLPLLEETGYMPVEKYSHSPEIHEHAQRLARHFDLYDDALFHTRITRVAWDPERLGWSIETDRGDAIFSRYVAMATGAFSSLKLPDLPGLEDFRGHSFHTSRWDYAYTGGAAESPLTNLKDKTVAVIGTGATAVQVVPSVAPWAKKLLVVQRTPSTIGVRGNRPTDPDWVESLEPGWQARRIDNFSRLVGGELVDEDLVNDGWTELYQALLADPKFRTLPPEEARARREAVDLAHMERIRQRISDVIEDQDVAERMKPYYNYLCKRPAFHDQFLDAFNRDNVELIDTDGAGIERITENGFIVDGIEHQADCIVFATGFEGSADYSEKVGIEFVGRDGTTLSERWSEGMLSLHGAMTHNFPNLFFNLGSVEAQGPISVNLLHALGLVADHVAEIVREAEARGARATEPEQDAELEWAKIIEAGTQASRKVLEACTPGRWNDEGKISARSLRSGVFPGSAADYAAKVGEWRDQGFPGLQFLDGTAARPDAESAGAR